MDILTRFTAYAGDFEKTLVDDDWSRLRDYFAADAVYRVESDVMGCTLSGRERIFAGIKKSLDGFDRKFDGRDLTLPTDPEVVGDELHVTWSLTYRKEGAPPYTLAGRTRARYRDGTIVELVDSYEPGIGADAAAWSRASGIAIDPSYV
jgi:hypothetical protein